MKNIAAILGMTFLAGCVSPQQQVLNEACDKSKEARDFPKERAVAEIYVRLEIVQGRSQINVNETAACDYQGSFCPAGKWYEVWYGNKEMKREILLPNERTLTIWHHSLCTSLDSYEKLCAQGNCKPADHFEFRLQLNPEEAEQRRKECSTQNSGGVTSDPDEFLRCGLPNVDLVTFEELKQYGYEVNKEVIEVLNVGS